MSSRAPSASLGRRELLDEELLDVLDLPVGDAHLLDRRPRRVLQEEVGRRALRERHLEVLDPRRLVVDKVLQVRVVRQPSAADVERRAGVHRGRGGVGRAARAALADERVVGAHKLTQAVHSNHLPLSLDN